MIRAGPAVTVEVRATALGLLSFGALIAGILLSTAVIVAAAGANARAGRRPL